MKGGEKAYLHKVLGVENGKLVPIDQLVQPLLRIFQEMILPDGKPLLDADRQLGIIVRTLRKDQPRFAWARSRGTRVFVGGEGTVESVPFDHDFEVVLILCGDAEEAYNEREVRDDSRSSGGGHTACKVLRGLQHAAMHIGSR